MLTQKELKKYLHYDSKTGVFTRIFISSPCVKIGDIAGTMKRGYITICVENKRHLAHRLAWLYVYGVWPKGNLDHINHNRVDNSISNLRLATPLENNRNQSKSKRNKSGVVGVCWEKVKSKWGAHIRAEGRNINLGSYVDKFDAICARMSANNKYGFHENHGI